MGGVWRGSESALPHHPHVKPRCPERLEHALRVVAAARLEHELHRRLAHVEVDALADVLDVDEVRALRRPPARAGPRATRPVGQPVKSTSRRPAAVSCRRAHLASSPASTLPPESTATTVPAGDAADAPGMQCRHAPPRPRPRPPASRSEHRDHRLGDLLLADDHDVVEPPLERAA